MTSTIFKFKIKTNEKSKLIFTREEFSILGHLFLWAFLVNFTVEIFNRTSLLQSLLHLFTNPVIFIYNTFIIFFTLSIVTLSKKRIFFTFIISGVWIGFGITNAILLKFRTTPFTAVDLKLIKSALSIADRYLNSFELGIIISGGILFITLILMVWKKFPKYSKPFSFFKNFILIIFIFTMLMLFTQMGLKTNILAANFGNLADAYKQYGFSYCFSNSLVNTGINKPNNYSPDTIDDIILNLNDNLLSDSSSEKDYNIIMLQLESFIDPSNIKSLSFSEEPLPTFKKLKKEFTSGYLSVPSIGAGTANTEFEIITGMNLDFFGPGEYPYKTILKKTTCESMAYNLKELNYKTHAIHNNEGTFYGRNEIFPNLGFDTFTPIEYMNNIELNPLGWAKDKILTTEILNTLNSTDEPDYIYTISVQGHGKYPDDENVLSDVTIGGTTENISQENLSSKATKIYSSTKNYPYLENYNTDKDAITVNGIDEERKFAFEYYVNQIHEMDQFIKELTTVLSQFDEKVILVMYGDHYPSLGISQEDLKDSDMFQTEYVIWDNFGLKKQDEDIQAYQLGAKVFEMVNIDNGTLTKFHQNNKNSENYLDNLKLLQYDMLYGNREIYESENPYNPTNLKMGIKDIVIDNIEIDGENLTISGKNFTQFSYITINDKVVTTGFIDSNTLSAINVKLSEGNIISVVQKGNDNYILSESNKIMN